MSRLLEHFCFVCLSSLAFCVEMKVQVVYIFTLFMLFKIQEFVQPHLIFLGIFQFSGAGPASALDADDLKNNLADWCPSSSVNFRLRTPLPLLGAGSLAPCRRLEL